MVNVLFWTEIVPLGSVHTRCQRLEVRNFKQESAFYPRPYNIAKKGKRIGQVFKHMMKRHHIEAGFQWNVIERGRNGNPEPTLGAFPSVSCGLNSSNLPVPSLSNF